MNAVLNRQTNADELRDLVRRCAAEAPLKGVMDGFEEEWPPARSVGEPLSSVVDLPLVQVMGGDLVSVAAWYDNEMGYSTRLAETAARSAKADVRRTGPAARVATARAAGDPPNSP